MKILIADKFPDEKLSVLNSLGHDVTYDPDASAENLAVKVEGIEVLIVRSTKVPGPVICAGSKLSLIIRAGAGYNTIDVAAASERGIFVANCPGKNSAAVAELAMGLMIAADRRIAQCTADLRGRQWNKKEYSKADGLMGKTLGIAGLGGIGREMLTRARGFGMKVIGWSRSLTEGKAADLGIGFCDSIQDLCTRSDVVSVHLALTPETKKLFDRDLFNVMKPGTIFVNTSRGGVVDQDALFDAMEEKGIRAALDVFDPEPASGKEEFDSRILTHPGLVGTHHIGASTTQAQLAVADEAIRILAEFAGTGHVPNCVNVLAEAPAVCTLIARHYDRVGVLAGVMDIIRAAGINACEITNTIFEGEKAAVATIRLSEMPSEEVVASIAGMEGQVIDVKVKRTEQSA